MCSATKFLEVLEDEEEVVRALVRDQHLHRKLSVVLAIDDDNQRQLESVPARRKTGTSRKHRAWHVRMKHSFLISMGYILQQRHNILTIPPHLHARVERVVLDDDGVVLHGILLLLRVRPRNAGDAALAVHFKSQETAALLQFLHEQLGIVKHRRVCGQSCLFDLLPDVSHLSVPTKSTRHQGKQGEELRFKTKYFALYLRNIHDHVPGQMLDLQRQVITQNDNPPPHSQSACPPVLASCR